MYNYLHNHTVIKAAYNVWHYIYTTLLHISALKKVCLKKRKDRKRFEILFLSQGDTKKIVTSLVSSQVLCLTLSLSQPCVRNYCDELNVL